MPASRAHTLVSCFLFNSWPPALHYSSTWNVDIVLSYLCCLPDFQILSHKLAMLFVLFNSNRCSIDFRVMVCFFVIPQLIKFKRKGPPLEIFYTEFTANPKLYPLHPLKLYEQRSSDLHRKNSPRNLFIIIKELHKLHKPITTGHWIKNVMKLSDIDTTLFSAHSTHGAATSKAKSVRLPVGETANWSLSSTFTTGLSTLGNLEELCSKADNQMSFQWCHLVSWLRSCRASDIQLQIPRDLIWGGRIVWEDEECMEIT